MPSDKNKLLEKKMSRWYGADHFNEPSNEVTKSDTNEPPDAETTLFSHDTQKHEEKKPLNEAIKSNVEVPPKVEDQSVSHENTSETPINLSAEPKQPHSAPAPAFHPIVIPAEHPKVTWGCKIPLELYDFIKVHDAFCYILPDPRSFRKKFIDWLMELKEKNTPLIEEAEKALNTVKLETEILSGTETDKPTEGGLPQKPQQPVPA